MCESQISRPPLLLFNLETAIQKVRLVEDGWNVVIQIAVLEQNSKSPQDSR